MRWLLLLCLPLLVARAEEGCAHPLRLHTSAATTEVYQKDIAWLGYVLAQQHCRLQVLNENVTSVSRLLRKLEIGEHDVATGLSRTPVRESFLYFSVPYTQDRLRVYRKAEAVAPSSSVTGFSLLRYRQQHVDIIAPLYGWFGDAYDDFRQQHLKDKGMHWYNKDADALRLMHENSQAVLVMSERILLSFPAEQTASLVADDGELFSDPLHMGFSRASVSAQEFDRLNQAISAMLARGVTPESYAQGKR